MPLHFPVTEHPFTAPQIDIGSVAFWDKSFEEREESFAWLRANAPLSWQPPFDRPFYKPDHGEPGFWAVTRRDDIQYVSQNHELFSSSQDKWHGIGVRPRDPDYTGVPTFLMMDPPDHTKYRMMMSAAFTPKAVRRVSAKIEERAAAIIDRVVGIGEFDFVREVSSKLPMQTVADLVGVPESLTEEFARAGDLFITAQDPDVRPEGMDLMSFMYQQATVLQQIGADLVEYRRRNPGDDLATAMAQFEDDGRRLGTEEIGRFMMMLSVAGNDTTKQTTTRAALALTRNPDQKRWLQEDFDGRIAQSIEEFIRYASPVMTFARTATQDMEFAGQDVARGDKLVLFYCSGNRDEAAFEEPSRFDLQRSPNGHVGFGGGGIHYCLGNGMAKAQLRAMFSNITTKLAHLELGEPQQLHSEFINGVKRLPARA